MSRFAAIAVVVGAAAAVGACTAESPVGPSPPQAVIAPTEPDHSRTASSTAEGAVRDTLAAPTRTVSPATATDVDVHNAIEYPEIEVGETIRLTSDCGTPATWRSSRPRVATVDNGLVTGVGAGTARITETCASVESAVIVRVRATSARFEFVPDPPTPSTVEGGDTGRFRVVMIRNGRRTRLTTGVRSGNSRVLRVQLEGDRWRWTAGSQAGRVRILVRHDSELVLEHPLRVTGGGGGGEAATVEGLQCSATGSQVTIEGTVRARQALRSITVRGYVDERFLGLQHLGNFRSGQTKSFRIAGTDPFLSAGSRCRVEVTGSVVGGLSEQRLTRRSVRVGERHSAGQR